MGCRISLGRNFGRQTPAYWLLLSLCCFVLYGSGCGDAGSASEDTGQVTPPLVIPDELTSELSPDRVATLVEMGREAFVQKGCIACHMVTGEPLTGPGLAGIFGQLITLSDGTEIDRDLVYLYKSIVVPNQYVSQAGPVVMPPYAFLEEETLVSLAYFIRSLGASAEALGSETDDE